MRERNRALTRRQTNLACDIQPNKVNRDLPPGGSFYRYRDKRQKQLGLRFTVLWHDGKKPCNQTFDIGYADKVMDGDIAVARAAALEFRVQYERCRRSGTEFDPSP